MGKLEERRSYYRIMEGKCQERPEIILSLHAGQLGEGLLLPGVSLQHWEKWLFFQMLNIQPKTIKHKKGKENMAYSRE
jgi:hypothetical protein